MRRVLLSVLLGWLTMVASADDRTLAGIEYWIDDNYSSRTTVDIGSDGVVQFSLNASALPEGLHALRYHALDSEGNYSPLQSWVFYRIAPSDAGGARTLEYWIDEGEHLSRDVDEADVAFVLDASAVVEGLHTLHYQVRTEGGRVSPLQSWMFYRVMPKATSLKWYRIWWNDHKDKAIAVQLPEGTVEYLYEETLAVPEYARNDGFSADNTATFHIVFGDDQGRVSAMETAVVGYPDIYPPVTTLQASKVGSDIVLTWQNDARDVKDYNVYYSENGEPYVLWKPNVQQQEATFRGQTGITYRFIVTARDVNGNYEAMEESKSIEINF